MKLVEPGFPESEGPASPAQLPMIAGVETLFLAPHSAGQLAETPVWTGIPWCRIQRIRKKRGSPRLKALLNRSKSLMVQAWTKYNESILGIRTEPEAKHVRPLSTLEPWKGEFSENSKYQDNFRYGTIGYRNIRKILQIVSPRPDDVFYDIGAGMGRVLCVAATRPLRKCVGIELIEPLCEVARKNAARLRGRKVPIDVICADATTVDLSDGTIYFLFNPFGPETLRHTFENIRKSLSQAPRAIRIVYYHSKHKSAVEDLDWLVKVRDFESFGGHPVTIWENQRSLQSHLPFRAEVIDFPAPNELTDRAISSVR
jgi:predicted RNA methylase